MYSRTRPPARSRSLPHTPNSSSRRSRPPSLPSRLEKPAAVQVLPQIEPNCRTGPRAGLAAEGRFVLSFCCSGKEGERGREGLLVSGLVTFAARAVCPLRTGVGALPALGTSTDTGDGLRRPAQQLLVQFGLSSRCRAILRGASLRVGVRVAALVAGAGCCTSRASTRWCTSALIAAAAAAITARYVRSVGTRRGRALTRASGRSTVGVVAASPRARPQPRSRAHKPAGFARVAHRPPSARLQDGPPVARAGRGPASWSGTPSFWRWRVRSAGEVRVEVGRRDADGIADARVRELAALAEQVDGRGAHAEQLGDLADAEQRRNAGDGPQASPCRARGLKSGHRLAHVLRALARSLGLLWGFARVNGCQTGRKRSRSRSARIERLRGVATPCRAVPTYGSGLTRWGSLVRSQQGAPPTC